MLSLFSHSLFLFSFIGHFLDLHFTFCPLSRSTVQKPPIPSSLPLPLWWELPDSPINSCIHALAFPYTRASNHFRPKGCFSHWYPTRPSSATNAAGAMGLSMCTLWLVVQSLGILAGGGSGQCTLLLPTWGCSTTPTLLLWQIFHLQLNCFWTTLVDTQKMCVFKVIPVKSTVKISHPRCKYIIHCMLILSITNV